MNSQSKRRLSKLEVATRPRIVVLTCRDGDQDRTTREYLAKTPEAERPEILIIRRRFTDADD